MGGKPTATILGDGHRTSAPWQPMQWHLAHAIDYDDVNEHLGGILRPGSISRIGRRRNLGSFGQGNSTGLYPGVEVETKIGLAINKVHYNLGWHPTATLGTFGAAAACCKVMKLDQDQVLMALGIAGSQASAIKQNFGTMTKPCTWAGSEERRFKRPSCLRGWTADRQILEGHFGFCNLFAGRGLYDLKDMTENLGKPFDVSHPGVQLKKYPVAGAPTRLSTPSSSSCRSILQAGRSGKGRMRGSSRAHSHPRSSQSQSGLEGKFSVEYCLATAILRGRVSLTDFTDERLHDKNLRLFSPRSRPASNPL